MHRTLHTFIHLTIPFLIAMSAPAQEVSRQLFELRLYKLKSEEKASLFDRTAKEAFLPALKRAGIGPIGVFKPKDKQEADGAAVLRYVVIPYDSAEAMLSLREKLAADPDFAAAAGDYLSVGKGEEVFDRIESSLLLAFSGMPKLKAPTPAKDPAKRFFELRTYESLSEMKGVLKVQMFNRAELAIFEKVGLRGVFFGEALTAANLPQLTYMLEYEDEYDHKAAWKRFLEHPDWLTLKGDETYKDTVSTIKTRFLLAMDYSQVK